jgi:hypothetical protein
MPSLLYANIIPQLDNQPDIEGFIEAELERCLVNRTLNLGDPALILEIQDALAEGAKGMFLWVVLLIQSLCAMRSDKEIRDALADLPRDLSAIYFRILEQSQQAGRPYQEEIFELLIAARRPLTVSEMKEALSVTPGDTNWDSSKLINDVYPVLATCGCLVIIDEDELTIRTVHPSVDKFYLDEYSAREETGVVTSTLSGVHNLMASIIVTYLSYEVFGNELIHRPPMLDIGLAPSKVIDSMGREATGIKNMALRLLKTRKRPKFDASKVIADGVQHYKTTAVGEFHFYLYAKEYALSHLLEQPRLSKDVITALSQLFQRGTIILETHEQRLAMFRLAVEQPGETEPIGLYETYIYYPYYGGILDHQKVFYVAIENGHVRTVEHLLDLCLSETGEAKKPAGSDRLTSTGTRKACNGPGLLQYAIRKHQNEVVQVLINSNWIDVNEKAIFTDEEIFTDNAILTDKAIWTAVFEQNHIALEMLLRTYRVLLASEEKQLLLSEAGKTGTFPRRTIELLEKYQTVVLHDEQPTVTRYIVVNDDLCSEGHDIVNEGAGTV